MDIFDFSYDPGEDSYLLEQDYSPPFQDFFPCNPLTASTSLETAGTPQIEENSEQQILAACRWKGWLETSGYDTNPLRTHPYYQFNTVGLRQFLITPIVPTRGAYFPPGFDRIPEFRDGRLLWLNLPQDKIDQAEEDGNFWRQLKTSADRQVFYPTRVPTNPGLYCFLMATVQSDHNGSLRQIVIVLTPDIELPKTKLSCLDSDPATILCQVLEAHIHVGVWKFYDRGFSVPIRSKPLRGRLLLSSYFWHDTFVPISKEGVDYIGSLHKVQHIVDLTANKRKTDPSKVSFIPEEISSQTKDHSFPQRANSHPITPLPSIHFLPLFQTRIDSPMSLDNLFNFAKLDVDMTLQKESIAQSFSLFALRDFSSGELITWYDGMIIPSTVGQLKPFPFKKFEGCSSVVIDPSHVPSSFFQQKFRRVNHGLGAMMTHVLGGGNVQLFSCQIDIKVPYDTHPDVSRSDKVCVEHTIFLLQTCRLVLKGQEFFLNYSTQDFVVLHSSQTAPLTVLNNHKSSDSIRKRSREEQTSSRHIF